jgi:L-asparagine oxygenase
VFSAASFASCVRDYVVQEVPGLSSDKWQRWLEDPSGAWRAHRDKFAQWISQAVDGGAFSPYMREQPFLHLIGAFDPSTLPDTPTAWTPIPDTPSTRSALATVILLAGLCGMEVVSYGCENDGQLFVNLVTLPGRGVLAEKSQNSMRGHTDAATFPFRGTTDPDFPRIAPSPDIVFLIGLRNPDDVPTVVMPLPETLSRMDGKDAALLKKPNLVLGAQKTFVQGTKRILGEAHLLDGAAVLFDGPEGTWVRYTHSQSHVHDESAEDVKKAKENFESACAASAQGIALRAGDILLVNNRKALHGRGKVGEAVGRGSRWLIRAYGLDCSQVSQDQRYRDSTFKLFP